MNPRQGPTTRLRALSIIAIAGLTLGCGRAAERPATAVGTQSDSIAYITWSLPTWASAVLQRGGYLDRNELFLGLNPYYLRGRFDADTTLDVAVQIRDKATEKRGVAIIHRSDSTVHVLGAGHAFANGGDDFTWLWVWRVEDRALLADPRVRGREVLYLEKPESGGGIVWWDGQQYRWTQRGD